VPVGDEVARLAEGDRHGTWSPQRLHALDVRELVTAEYLRPIPAQSDYLDTAVRPVPWPARAAPREPRGGRPMLGAERRLTGSKRAAAVTRAVARPP
jgi:hypothetical protein